MTKQRQRVLDAIREAVAEGVPATYEEIGRRTGMNRNALKSHCEKLAAIKPAHVSEVVGHPVDMPRRRFVVTIQKGERKPAEVEVDAVTTQEALMSALRRAGYSVEIIFKPDNVDGTKQDG